MIPFSDITNKNGLTFNRWLAAAGVNVLHATNARMVRLRREWDSGVDPTEYKARLKKRLHKKAKAKKERPSLVGTLGMLFFREAGEAPNGTKMLMVVGLIPETSVPEIEGERQYVVDVVPAFEDFAFPRMIIRTDKPIDRTKEAQGLSADGLLTSPFWRTG
jgi:hypothetical protein